MKMFSSKKQSVATPTVLAPAAATVKEPVQKVIPIEDTEITDLERKRRLAEAQSRGGIASTTMSAGDILG